MNTGLEFTPACLRGRWVGYFDLLGTSALVRSGDLFEVFLVYERAIREVRKWNARLERIQHAWFSDTFLIYSEQNSISDFVAMDLISRWFMYFLISARIPVRGAMACGDLYADAIHRVYLGQALVEAYEFGEAQDWIGFLLCPSAVARLDAVGLPAGERLHYAFSEIPLKRAMSVTRLPACILGEWAKINGENQILLMLSQMKASQKDGSIARKYENAIAFIEQNRLFVSRSSRPAAP